MQGFSFPSIRLIIIRYLMIPLFDLSVEAKAFHDINLPQFSYKHSLKVPHLIVFITKDLLL